MNKIAKVMVVSMITNSFLSILKIIVGTLGHSSALIADGVHSFSDLSTDMVAVIGNHISNKPADEKHPFGHGKIEYITSIIISLVILTLGLGIIYNSIDKEIVIPSIIVVLVSIITILAKYALSHYIIVKGKKYQNNILIASGYESRTDVISSVVVLLSATVMQLTSVWEGFQYADMIASVIVGLLIVRIGFSILKDNLSTILGEQETDQEYLKQIKKIILQNKNIEQVDEMTVLKYGSYYKFIGEVSVDSNLTILEAHRYIHEVENALKTYDHRMKYITIHVNPYKNINYELRKATNQDKKRLTKYIKETITENKRLRKKEMIAIENNVQKTIEEHLSDFSIIWYHNRPIGCLGYYKIEENRYYLDTIYITPEYQGLRIGSSIVTDLLKNIKEKDSTLRLWVYKDNYSAINLYERFGFKVIEETKTRYQLESTNNKL